MTMQQFNELEEMEKISTILQHGCLLAQNSKSNSRIFLYKLETFYVTASYNLPGDELIEISCFNQANHLPPLFYRHMLAINPAEREYQTPKF